LRDLLNEIVRYVSSKVFFPFRREIVRWYESLDYGALNVKRAMGGGIDLGACKRAQLSSPGSAAEKVGVLSSELASA
jgi:hypothetical protein